MNVFSTRRIKRHTDHPHRSGSVFHSDPCKIYHRRRTANLVRGMDEHRYWDADPMPKGRLDDEIINHVRVAGERYVDLKYRQEAEDA